jgi:hypothetical protein
VGAKVDPVAGIGFMVARRGTYHARIDAKHDGWRLERVDKQRPSRSRCRSDVGLAESAVEDVLLSAEQAW